MAMRSTAALILLAESLAAVGEDPAPALRRCGLDPAGLDPSALIDREVEMRANVAVAEELRDPTAGAKSGASLGLGTYGPFSMLLLTCQDFLASVHTAVRYQRLSFLFGHLGFVPGRTHSALRLEPAPLRGRAYRFRADLEVAAVWKLVLDVTRAANAPVIPLSVHMPYPRPQEGAFYADLFGCTVDWGTRDARVVVGNDGLHVPFASADAASNALMRSQCERQILALEAASGGISDRVRAYLAARTDSPPEASGAAAAVGLSERSMRRKLAEEGSNFRSLLDEARLERARWLLRDPRQPVESVARHLGYSEPAAFVRAFRRWAGVSPSAYRRAQDAAAPDSHPGSRT